MIVEWLKYTQACAFFFSRAINGRQRRESTWNEGRHENLYVDYDSITAEFSSRAEIKAENSDADDRDDFVEQKLSPFYTLSRRSDNHSCDVISKRDVCEKGQSITRTGK